MRIRKIIYILIAFLLIVMNMEINSYADSSNNFSAGEKVQCNKKSFWYEPNGKFERFLDENGKYVFFNKGQVLTYIDSTPDSTICKVKCDTSLKVNGIQYESGREYYVKKVNLDPYKSSNDALGKGGTGYEEPDYIKEAEEKLEKENAIYTNPKRVDDNDNAEQSIDDMIGDADEFINSGHSNYDEEALQNFSKTMYNILLAVGVAVAVIVGGIIGLKFMTVTSAEEKAEITKLLIPYLVGCIVVFGGFAIWRIAVNILSNI